MSLEPARLSSTPVAKNPSLFAELLGNLICPEIHPSGVVAGLSGLLVAGLESAPPAPWFAVTAS